MMKLIKKIIYALTNLFFLTAAFAVTPIENPLSSTFKDIPSTVNWASSFILPIATLSLATVLAYAGVLFQWAKGNPEKEAEVWQRIRGGFLGFFMAISGSLVISIVGALLGIRLLALAKS